MIGTKHLTMMIPVVTLLLGCAPDDNATRVKQTSDGNNATRVKQTSDGNNATRVKQAREENEAARIKQTLDDYKATVRSARTALPIAVQIEETFPVADHFITSYALEAGPRTWQTDVYFGGRYNLGMAVDVQIDYSSRTLKRIGEPKFYLEEVTQIDILPDGRVESTYHGVHKQFGEKEWGELYMAKGDLSVLGVAVNRQKVENWGRFVAASRRDRIVVSLLEE